MRQGIVGGGLRLQTPLSRQILCTTAQAFPHGERNKEISWDAHFEAGTPNNLAEASAALRKLKKKISSPNMRWLMSEWREKADQERKRENEAAKASRATAKAKKAAASARKLAAKNKAEREAAEAERRRAKEEEVAAAERVRKSDFPTPSYNTDVAAELQDKGTLEVMAVHLVVTSQLGEVERRTRVALRQLADIAEYVTPAMIAEIETATAKIIAAVEEIKSTVGLHKQARYQVVKGGAA